MIILKQKRMYSELKYSNTKNDNDNTKFSVLVVIFGFISLMLLFTNFMLMGEHYKK